MTMRRFNIITLLLLFSSGAWGQVCTAPLSAVGPVNPANGFPRYYIDSAGVGLQPCLSAVCDPALAEVELSADGTRVIFDPALPVSFPTNFPAEFFYFRGISTIDTPTGGRATLVLALEGAFANEDPAPGDQMVFARTRATLVRLQANTRYRVTHPYGTFDGLTDGLGNGRTSTDVGTIPGVFTTALNGGIGPFLRFATGAVPPPPNQIGNPAADQTVTGSLCNQNFFRIQ